MKQTSLKRITGLKSHSGLKQNRFKRKVLDFESNSPDNPMLVLDRIFSEVIRRQYADERGLVSCYTCGIMKHWKEMQCGHFRPRQHLSTRYNETNCKVQCPDCNEFKNGNLEEFSYRLCKEYGPDVVERLYKLSQMVAVNFPWEEKLRWYKASLAVLVAEQDMNIEY